MELLLHPMNIFSIHFPHHDQPVNAVVTQNPGHNQFFLCVMFENFHHSQTIFIRGYNRHLLIHFPIKGGIFGQIFFRNDHTYIAKPGISGLFGHRAPMTIPHLISNFPYPVSDLIADTFLAIERIMHSHRAHAHLLSNIRQSHLIHLSTPFLFLTVNLFFGASVKNTLSVTGKIIELFPCFVK